MTVRDNLPPVRELAFAEPVTITLPAYLWWAFHSWYRSIEAASWEATIINEAVQEALLEPSFIKAQEAENQARESFGQRIAARFLGESTGPPAAPPDEWPFGEVTPT